MYYVPTSTYCTTYGHRPWNIKDIFLGYYFYCMLLLIILTCYVCIWRTALWPLMIVMLLFWVFLFIKILSTSMMRTLFSNRAILIASSKWNAKCKPNGTILITKPTFPCVQRAICNFQLFIAFMFAIWISIIAESEDETIQRKRIQWHSSMDVYWKPVCRVCSQFHAA